MSTLFDDPRVADLFGGAASGLVALFRQMEIAEEEIAAARDGRTEKDEHDPLWGAFTLLRTTDDLMRTEFVYRAHCREILARVKAGEDTRPATDAEIACGISSASMRTPLGGAAVTLLTRIFKRTFPEQYEQLGFDIAAHERVHGEQADELERELRRAGRQDWRKPGQREETK